MKYSLASNYHRDGECKRCPCCHGENLIENVIDTINYTVCEKEIVCGECNERVNYWAYGSYDPAFQYYDRSLVMLFVRVKDNIKAIFRKRAFTSEVL